MSMVLKAPLHLYERVQCFVFVVTTVAVVILGLKAVLHRSVSGTVQCIITVHWSVVAIGGYFSTYFTC